MSEVLKMKSATIGATATALSDAGWAWAADDLARATRALVSSTQPVMFTLDGSAPTATVGHPIGAGGTTELTDGREIRAVQLIRSTGVDAVVTVTLLKD